MWDLENRGCPGDAKDKRLAPHTPASCYDEDYFLSACEGHERFGRLSTMDGMSPRLAAALQQAHVRPGERILDIGCGRGEVALRSAQGGSVVHAVDYSGDAMRIAQRSLGERGAELEGRVCFLRGDARHLPFEADRFDKLLMFDLVEHLYPWELTKSLREAWRVLVGGGQLIIHTAPNRWYYRYGYPVYRLFERLRGRHLPRNPRDRFPCHHLHVNEQDIIRLRRLLRSVGFKSEVRLENIQPSLPGDASTILRFLVRILLDVYPFRWIFRNDIFAIAHKQE